MTLSYADSKTHKCYTITLLLANATCTAPVKYPLPEHQLVDDAPSQIMTQPLLLAMHSIGVQIDQHTILENIDLAVHQNEIVTLIGPNGSGKSTLLRVALGLLVPGSGSVTRTAGLRVGYMPQKLKLNPSIPITVERFLTLSERHSKRQLHHRLSQVGALTTLKAPLQAISGGELQRVLLARAILRNPQLLILDEPAQGVDIQGQQSLYHLLAELRDELHCGILMVSHDLHFVMAATDQVICINRHVCCSGSAESVQNHPEYLTLFDNKPVEDIAIYKHHHDHDHDLHGDVLPSPTQNNHHKGCDHA